MRGAPDATSVALRWNTPHPSRRCAPIHLLPQGEKGRRNDKFQSTFNLFRPRLWTMRIGFDSLMAIRACGVSGSSSIRQIGECHLWPRRTRGARPEGRLLRVVRQGAMDLPAIRA
ncbi:hypothetical protein CK230_05625 [Mesorhizobium sp. WSM3859]|nr:hypothetical protein CK230_05625 [Mesorhizobium sp. WSM3859]